MSPRNLITASQVSVTELTDHPLKFQPVGMQHFFPKNIIKSKIKAEINKSTDFSVPGRSLLLPSLCSDPLASRSSGLFGDKPGSGWGWPGAERLPDRQQYMSEAEQH